MSRLLKLSVCLALCLPYAASTTTTKNAARVGKLPLTHIVSRKQELLEAGKWKQYLEAKNTALLKRLQQQPATLAVTQSITDYDDLEYLGHVYLGSPPQEFTVIVDTASANLWVPSAECTYGCKGNHLFDSNRSTTFQTDGRPWELAYTAAYAAGVLGIDTMTLGEKPYQLEIVKQTFGMAMEMVGFPTATVDGVFGMAFTALAEYNIPTPISQAYAQGAMKSPTFTVWLQHRGSGEGTGGLVTYGYPDVDHCDIVLGSIPLSSATFWQFMLKKIGAGSYTSPYGATAVSDTSAGSIVGPQDIVHSLATTLGATWNMDYNFYEVDCSSEVQPIELGIGRWNFVINSTDFVAKVNITEEPVYGGEPTSQIYCYLELSANTWGGWNPTWFLGAPFIRSYCNVYNFGLQRIFFAKAKNL